MIKPLYYYNLEIEPISTVLTTQWIVKDTACLVFPGLMPPVQKLLEVDINHQNNRGIEKKLKESIQRDCIDLLDKTQCIVTLLNYARYLYWSNRIVPFKELKPYADLLEEIPVLKNSDKFSLWGIAYLVVRCKECGKFFSCRQYTSRSDSDLYKFNISHYDTQLDKYNCSACVSKKHKENLKQHKREEILENKDEFCKLIYIPDNGNYQYKNLAQTSNFSSPGLNLYNLIVNNFKICKNMTDNFKSFVAEHLPEYFNFCQHIYFIMPFEYVILKNSNFLVDIDELKESIIYPLRKFSEYIGHPNTELKLRYTVNNYRDDNLWFDIPLLNYLIHLGWHPSDFIYDVSINDRCFWIHFDLTRKSTFEGLKTKWYKIENENFWEEEDIWEFKNTYYKYEAEFTSHARLLLEEYGLNNDIVVKFNLFITPDEVFKPNTIINTKDVFSTIEEQLAETSEYWKKLEILKQAPQKYFDMLKSLSQKERLATQNWDAVRRIILKQNNFECALKNEVTPCGSRLEVHHKTYEYWCYEHLHLESCVVLCNKHHRAAHYDKH